MNFRVANTTELVRAMEVAGDGDYVVLAPGEYVISDEADGPVSKLAWLQVLVDKIRNWIYK